MSTLLAALETFLEAVAPIRRHRLLKPHIERATTKLGKAFTAQGRLYLADLAMIKDKFTEAVAPPVPPPADDAKIDAGLAAFDAITVLTALSMADPIDELVSAAMQTGGTETIADLAMELSFDLKNPRAVQFLQRRGAEQVRRIDETTRNQLRTLLVDGVSTGESYTSMAARIKEMFEGFSTQRATRIAVTESAFAYESGKAAVVSDLSDGGLTMEKATLTAGDDRVEDDCLANEADGWIPFEQPFSSGNQQAPFHIGCRCTTLYRMAGSTDSEAAA